MSVLNAFDPNRVQTFAEFAEIALKRKIPKVFNEHEATAGVIVKEDDKTFLVLSDQENRTYRFLIQPGLRNKLAREMVNLSL